MRPSALRPRVTGCGDACPPIGKPVTALPLLLRCVATCAAQAPGARWSAAKQATHACTPHLHAPLWHVTLCSLGRLPWLAGRCSLCRMRPGRGGIGSTPPRPAKALHEAIHEPHARRCWLAPGRCLPPAHAARLLRWRRCRRQLLIQEGPLLRHLCSACSGLLRALGVQKRHVVHCVCHSRCSAWSPVPWFVRSRQSAERCVAANLRGSLCCPPGVVHVWC